MVPILQGRDPLTAVSPRPSERRFLECVACTVGRRGGRRLPLWGHREVSPSFLRRSSERLPPRLRFLGSTRRGFGILPSPYCSARRIAPRCYRPGDAAIGVTPFEGHSPFLTYC